jgi:nicotinate-nucleotide pyrophosphorylase (carboxylating)
VQLNFLDNYSVPIIPNHPSESEYLPLIMQGLKEDIGMGDLTTNIFIADDAVATCEINARTPLVLCGAKIAKQTFLQHDATIQIEALHHDGAHLSQGETIMRLHGNARALLTAERTALNFLQYLSGIASFTAQCVAELEGTGAELLDTRKTLPTYRHLAKYAVRCGGGRNHRLRLDDGVMLKDNHIAIAGDLVKAVLFAKMHTPALTKIEVECDTLEQVKLALQAGADVIMLDNMDLEMVKAAVVHVAGRVPLEVSGGVGIHNLRQYALAGVQFISMGALTHSVKAADIGMDYVC